MNTSMDATSVYTDLIQAADSAKRLADIQAEKIVELQREVENQKAKAEPFRKSNVDLSKAYMRLREILNAYQTPYSPTPEQIYQHTEECAREAMVALLEKRQSAGLMKDIMQRGSDGLLSEIRYRMRAMTEQLPAFSNIAQFVIECAESAHKDFLKANGLNSQTTDSSTSPQPALNKLGCNSSNRSTDN